MYSPFRHIGSIFCKRNPLHLTVFLTRSCNQRCPFCFYLKDADNSDKSKIPPRPWSPSAPPEAGKPPLTKGGRRDLESGSAQEVELSLDELQKISSSLGNLLWLAFSGGEIFLRSDLVEISRVFYENNKPAIMLFPTNGMLPEVIKDKTEQILRHCKNSVIAVKLSVDGLKDRHDAIRNTNGSFDKTMQTYQMLAGLLEKYPNFELGINTVCCSLNQDDMDGIIDFVSGLKDIKTHTISLIRGNISEEDYKKTDYKKYLHAVERLEKNLKNKTASVYRFKGSRLKAAQDIIQRRLIHETMIKKRRLIPCYAGRLNLVLTETGDVYPCEFFSGRMKLGNVKDNGYDLRRILKTEKAQEIIRLIKNKGCYCTHECYFMVNILFNPSMYPALFKEYLNVRSV
ncbi:MAG: radical SAM protein [Nitrospirae bacterium]|nr:radical SAM protein [Nitrospirota bacterium]